MEAFLVAPVRISGKEAKHGGFFAGGLPCPVLFEVVLARLNGAASHAYHDPDETVERNVDEEATACC